MIKKLTLETKGMALLSVLLLTVLMVLMTVSMIFISTNHLNMIGNIEGKEKALKAAEAGIEYAIYMLDQDPAWGLSGDPNFPGALSVDPNNSATWPKFAPNSTIDISNEPFTSDCKFSITFNSASPLRSVNNLFNPVKGDANTPAYAAKIVSTGKLLAGSQEKVTKTIVAYLVRSDVSPYSINVAKRLSLDAEPNEIINIYGRTTTDPGRIYSGFDDPNSIASGYNANIKTNNGVFSSRGGINLKTGTIFDGQKMENLTQNYSFGKIDIDSIVANAGNNVYGSIPHVSTGEIKLVSNIPPWENGYYYSLVSFGSLTPGFTQPGVVDIANYPGMAIVKLNQDIYVDGIPGDNLKITGDESILTQIRRYGYSTDDGHFYNPLGNPARVTYLDLNGHNIYSNSSLTFGISLIGTGKIISRGDVHYRTGVNANEIITAATGDVKIELDSRKNYTKGLIYASDNIVIQPFDSNGELSIPGEGDPNNPKCQDYMPGVKFDETGPKETAVGVYHDPPPYDDHGHTVDPPAYYDGSEMKVTKWITNTGDYMLLVEGADKSGADANLQICLDYNSHQNVDFGNYKVGIIPQSDGSFDVKIVNDYGHVLSPQPALSITSTQLTDFGLQVNQLFNNLSQHADMEIKGTIAGLQNLVMDPGPSGNITVDFYPDYLNSMVNMQRKLFTVRKISTYEL